MEGGSHPEAFRHVTKEGIPAGNPSDLGSGQLDLELHELWGLQGKLPGSHHTEEGGWGLWPCPSLTSVSISVA